MRAGKTGLWSIVLYGTAMNFGIRWLATGAATGPVALPVWLLAAALFLIPLTIATFDLSDRFPGEGAIYAWTRQTQGPFAGFMCGWLYWACNLPFFCGLLIFIDALLARVVGGAAGAWIAGPAGTLILSTLLIAFISFLHSRGLSAGKWIPILGAATSLILLVFFIGAALWLGGRDGPATDLAHASYLPSFDASGAILWSTMVFAYGGAEGVALLRNEVKGGAATLRVALILVGLFLAVAYVAGTASMLTILPQDQASRLAGLPDAIAVALQKVSAAQWTPLLLAGLALVMLGGLSAWFGVAARLPFAAGLDSSLPPALAKVDPRTGAPSVAIWTQAVLVVAILSLSQLGATAAAAYDFVNAMSVLSYTLPYLFLFVAYWKAQGPGGGRARGVAALGFVVALSAIALSFVPSPDATDSVAAITKMVFAAFVLIASGAILYLLGKLRKKEAS